MPGEFEYWEQIDFKIRNLDHIFDQWFPKIIVFPVCLIWILLSGETWTLLFFELSTIFDYLKGLHNMLHGVSSWINIHSTTKKSILTTFIPACVLALQLSIRQYNFFNTSLY